MKNITHEEFSVLLSKFKPMITSIVSSYRGRCRQYGIDPEDLEQTAAFKLWRLALRYDADSEDFPKYARTAVSNCICNTVMRHATGLPTGTRLRYNMNRYPPANVSIDARIEASCDNIVLCGVHEEDETQMMVDRFISSLPEILGNVLDDRMAGYTLEEVAHRRNMSMKQVQKAIGKIQIRLLKFMAIEEECMRSDAA